MAQQRKRVKKTLVKQADKVQKVKKEGLTNLQSRILSSICLAFFAVFMIFSFYFNLCGAFGEFILSFFKGLMGNMAYILPVLTMVFAVHIIVYRDEDEGFLHNYVSGTILLFLFSGFAHLWNYTDNSHLYKNIVDIYAVGGNGMGGGLIGALLTMPLIKVCSVTGTFLILITAWIIALLFFTNFAPTQYLAYLVRKKMNQTKPPKKPVVDAAVIPKTITKKKNSYDVFADKDGIGTNKADIDDDDEMILPPTEDEEDLEIKIYPNEQLGIAQVVEAPKPQHIEPLDIDASPIPVPYTYPTLDLLTRVVPEQNENDKPEDLRLRAKKLIDTLQSFGVEAKILEVSRGPSVTRFELQPKVGVKVSKITGLSDDIALNLAATGVRIEAPIPGKAAIGIEIPNKSISTVPLRDVLESPEFIGSQSKVSAGLGKDISGKSIIADIAKMPHMLIAGATGSGKSVCINSLITSILFKATPNEVRLVMIDPKVVELSVYNGIPHLLIPVVTDPHKAAGALSWAVQEMTVRYKLFADTAVRDIKGYNRVAEKNGWELLPQIVIIIDELADLMMVAPRDVEDHICRLAQLARAAGMHLVIATQRPSVDVITGIIKANIPSRIAFAVASQVDSRTILDSGGAEKLLGKGDMLYFPSGASKPIRVQGAFISDQDVERLVDFVKNGITAAYDEDILDRIEKSEGTQKSDDAGDADELLPKAIEVVCEAGQASVSLVQRRLRVGYSRAGRLIDQMEERGIIGPNEGSKPRSVLITRTQYLEMNDVED